MNKSKIAIITVAIVAFGIILNIIRSNVTSIPFLKGVDSSIIQGVIIVIGIIAAAVIGFLVQAKFSVGSKQESKSSTAEAPAEITDLGDLLHEAESRLGDADSKKDAKLGNLPVILILGETGSAKTHTVLHSGLDPELLSGQMYDENNLLPTPTANIWFTKHTVFVDNLVFHFGVAIE